MLEIPDWIVFMRAEDILLRQSWRRGKTTLASSPPMKWHIFQAYFSNSARFMAICLRVEDLQRALYTFQFGGDHSRFAGVLENILKCWNLQQNAEET